MIFFINVLGSFLRKNRVFFFVVYKGLSLFVLRFFIVVIFYFGEWYNLIFIMLLRFVNCFREKY